MILKPIELTEKHKEMLLKMCRELFPEYSKIQFQDIYNNETGNLYFDNVNSGIIIHWFEFCMNDLAGKIYNTLFTNKQSENWFGSHYNWVCWALNTKKPNKIHIIDYLYEQFIKIKNNDNKKEKK